MELREPPGSFQRARLFHDGKSGAARANFHEELSRIVSTLSSPLAPTAEKTSAARQACEIFRQDASSGMSISNEDCYAFAGALASALSQASSTSANELTNSLLELARTFGTLRAQYMDVGLAERPDLIEPIARPLLALFSSGYEHPQQEYNPLACANSILVLSIDSAPQSYQSLLVSAITTIYENIPTQAQIDSGGAGGYSHAAANSIATHASRHISEKLTPDCFMRAMGIYFAADLNCFKMAMTGIANFLGNAKQRGFLSQVANEGLVSSFSSRTIQFIDAYPQEFSPAIGQPFSVAANLCKDYISPVHAKLFMDAYSANGSADLGACALALCMANPALLDSPSISTFANLSRQTGEKLVANAKEWGMGKNSATRQIRGFGDFKAIFTLATTHEAGFIDTLASFPFSLGYFGQYPAEALERQFDFYARGEIPQQYLFSAHAKTTDGVDFGRGLRSAFDSGLPSSGIQLVIFEPGTKEGYEQAILHLQSRQPSIYKPLTVHNGHGMYNLVRIGKRGAPKPSDGRLDCLDTESGEIFSRISESFKGCKGTFEYVNGACSTAENVPGAMNFSTFLAGAMRARVWGCTGPSYGLDGFTLRRAPAGGYEFASVEIRPVTLIDMSLTSSEAVPRRVEVSSYPSPATNRLNIDASGIQGTVRVEFFNALGQKIGQLPEQDGGGVISADLTLLPPGAYYFTLTGQDGMPHQGKAVKR